jgi:malate dehydrogenase
MHQELLAHFWWKVFCAIEGEYGQSDICMGVPVIVGRNGWESIVDYKLNEAEQAAFNKSADAVRNMNDVLSTLDI